MLKMFATAAILGGGLYLSACATLNESECQTVDWRQLGDSDGSQGHGQTRIAKHVKACEKHGIVANNAAYNEGWQSGIARYCTPQNGYNIGRQGGQYAGTCPSELADPFLTAYRPSFNFTKAQQRVSDLERKIDQSIDNLAKWAVSNDPKLRQQVPDEKIKLNTYRADLPLARSDAELARRDLEIYLAANPQIQSF